MKFRDLVNNDELTFINILMYINSVFYNIFQVPYYSHIINNDIVLFVSTISIILAIFLALIHLLHILCYCSHTNEHLTCVQNFKQCARRECCILGFLGIIESYNILHYDYEILSSCIIVIIGFNLVASSFIF